MNTAHLADIQVEFGHSLVRNATKSLIVFHVHSGPDLAPNHRQGVPQNNVAGDPLSGVGILCEELLLDQSTGRQTYDDLCGETRSLLSRTGGDRNVKEYQES